MGQGKGTSRDAIIECFRAHSGGPLKKAEAEAWINNRYPGRWKDIGTDLADLVIEGNTSSTYRDNERCLDRVGRGVYQLNPAFMK